MVKKGKSIWLYVDNDSYNSLSHGRKNYAMFTAAGGKGMFYVYNVPAKNGHWLPVFPALWEKDLEAYLKHMGLPSRRQEANHADAADAKKRVSDQPGQKSNKC